MGYLLCSNVVLLQSISTGPHTRQDFGTVSRSMLLFFILSRIIQVVATLTCDTIHQALVTHSGVLIVIQCVPKLKYLRQSTLVSRHQLYESFSTRVYALVGSSKRAFYHVIINIVTTGL